MESSHTLRMDPGTVLSMPMPGFTSFRAPIVAAIGLHGLRIQVDIYENLPSHRMRDLLSLFSMFHGPLNEVCIQGFDDSSHWLAVEQSVVEIKTLRHYFIWEQIVHMLQMHKCTIGLLDTDHGDLAQELFPRVELLIRNVALQDSCPGSSIITTSSSVHMKLLLMVLFVFEIHVVMANFMSYRPKYYGSVGDPMFASRDVLIAAALQGKLSRRDDSLETSCRRII